MKKIILTLVWCVCMMSTAGHTFAHTHLESTTPVDGETIKEPVMEIILSFEGQIEQGSTVELITENGEAIEMKDVSIDDGVMTGTLATPLANGAYVVNWSSISADGHPIEGEFTFAVDMPVVEEEPQSTDDDAAPLTEIDDEEKAEKSPFTSTMFGIVLALVLVMVASFFFLLKRRK